MKSDSRWASVSGFLAAASLMVVASACGSSHSATATAVTSLGSATTATSDAAIGNSTSTAPSGGSASGSSPGPSRVILHGTLSVTGAVSATVDFTDSRQLYPTSCADYASVGTGPRDVAPNSAAADFADTFDLPAPPDSYPTVDGSLRHWAGPGTYDTGDADTDISVSTELLVNYRPSGRTERIAAGYSSDPTASESVTVNADGSGTFTFSNYVRDLGPNSPGPDTPPLSGSMKWTCSSG